MRSRLQLMSPASPERWLELLAVAASAKKSTKGGPPVILFLFTFAKSKGFRKNIFSASFVINQGQTHTFTGRASSRGQHARTGYLFLS